MAINLAELRSPTPRPRDRRRARHASRRRRAVPRGRDRRGRLPRLPPEPGHLRPAPGRPQPDGAGQGPVRPGRRPSSSRCSRYIAETYSRGWGHLTTRQNVQFHFVAARADARGAAPARRRSGSPAARRAATPSATSPAATSPARARTRCSTSPRGPRRPPTASCATRSRSGCRASSRSTSPAARPTAARRCSTTSA